MNYHDNSQPLIENVLAEQILLGTLFVNNAAFDVASRILEPHHFYEPIHSQIFRLAGEMIAKGRAVNPVTIKTYLPADKLVGEMTVSQYLARLAAEAVSVSGAREYASAIHDAWSAREASSLLQNSADEILSAGPDRDVFELLATIEERIANLRGSCITQESKVGIGRKYVDGMAEARKRKVVNGVPICLPEIEEIISEPLFEAGNLYGLLSSSGEGKTSLTLQIILHALERGHPVQFLSYDQSSDQCIRQMVAQKHGIEARRQRFNDLSEKEWDKIVKFGDWLDQQPFEVVKCIDQTAGQLVAMARTFVKRFSNGATPLIVVDHIGSVKPEDNRADEGTKAKNINKVFKAGAESTKAAWLVLNQRNSYGMKRDNPRPISADLYGGDPAKQAYDAIMYLYRQEKFKAERIATAASDSDHKKINRVFGTEIEGIAELGVIKSRFGNPSITRNVKFEDRFTHYDLNCNCCGY